MKLFQFSLAAVQLAWGGFLTYSVWHVFGLLAALLFAIGFGLIVIFAYALCVAAAKADGRRL